MQFKSTTGVSLSLVDCDLESNHEWIIVNRTSCSVRWPSAAAASSFSPSTFQSLDATSQIRTYFLKFRLPDGLGATFTHTDVFSGIARSDPDHGFER